MSAGIAVGSSEGNDSSVRINQGGAMKSGAIPARWLGSPCAMELTEKWLVGSLVVSW
jgi:hypothetical protein